MTVILQASIENNKATESRASSSVLSPLIAQVKVSLLLDPFLVAWNVSIGLWRIHKCADVCHLVYIRIQVCNVIRNSSHGGVETPQPSLKVLAQACMAQCLSVRNSLWTGGLRIQAGMCNSAHHPWRGAPMDSPSTSWYFCWSLAGSG